MGSMRVIRPVLRVIRPVLRVIRPVLRVIRPVLPRGGLTNERPGSGHVI